MQAIFLFFYKKTIPKLSDSLMLSFSGLTPVSSTGQAPNPVPYGEKLDSPIKSGNDTRWVITYSQNSLINKVIMKKSLNLV
jgi:hypothetical protein